MARELYGQQFNFCVFDDGTSCQIEDIASGWCIKPTPSPTPSPTPAPTLPPFMNPQTWRSNGSSNNNNGSNYLAAMIPALLGRAGSDYQGYDLGTPGYQDGMEYGPFGGQYGYGGDGAGGAYIAGGPRADASGAYIGQMGDPTRFFNDQPGLANTGVTDAVTSALTNQQAQQNGGAPQPVPVVVQPGQPGGETQAPGETPTANPLLTQLVAQRISQASTPPPKKPFLRVTNPLLYMVAGLLVGLIYYAYRRFASPEKMSSLE